MRAYVFPGQGVQKKGMGKGLFEQFPDLCRQADEVLGYSVEALCSENHERLLSSTEYAQPAIYVVNALHFLAARREDRPAPDAVAGHSLGEYNALFAAGAFDFVTGVRLVKHRSELMGRADGGAMAAVVGASEEAIEETLKAQGASGVVIANHNAPRQFVLSGSREELKRIKPAFEELEGVRGFALLRVSGAFHSPHMEPAAEEFGAFLDSVRFTELRTPVVSNVTGRPFPSSEQGVRDLLAQQITRPVRWAECVRYLRAAGVSEFVELGGSKVLTSLIDKIPAEPAAAADGQERLAGTEREDLIARIKRDVLQPVVGDRAFEFDENQSFRQLGLDSIVSVRLARRVQEVFGIPFKPDVMYRNRTCAALADYLLAHQDDAKAAPTAAVRDHAAPDGVAPKGAAPWRAYRDERVLAVLRDCANGALGVPEAVATIRAGMAGHS